MESYTRLYGLREIDLQVTPYAFIRTKTVSSKCYVDKLNTRYSFYSNNCTIIRYSDIQTCGSPTCFGLYRSSLGRYSSISLKMADKGREM
jgi:hypothetical protein